MSSETIHVRLQLITRELVNGDIGFTAAVKAFEEKYIAASLEVARGNVSRAAKKMGLHRNTLIKKLVGRDHIPRIRQTKRYGTDAE